MELKRFIFAVALYFGFCSGKGTFTTFGSNLIVNKTKLEHQLNSVVEYGSGKADGHRYRYKPMLIPPVISKRDSYVEAANSIGGEEHAGYSISYHVPQEPTSGGYSEHRHQHHHHHPQLSPYGAGDIHSSSGYYSQNNDDFDHEQSSKGGGDLVGLLGLLGLAGLKGTIPLIKIATVTFVALLPVLVPLTLLKLGIVFLKPVITFERNLESPGSHLIVQGLMEIEKFMQSDEGKSRSRDERSKCMERIACEGLFESLPRIFLRILGQNTLTVSGKKKVAGANGRSHKNTDKDKDKSTATSRRKDLAELALNRLKNSQFLTRKPTTEDHDKVTQTVCQQYKCPMLF